MKKLINALTVAAVAQASISAIYVLALWLNISVYQLLGSSNFARVFVFYAPYLGSSILCFIVTLLIYTIIIDGKKQVAAEKNDDRNAK